MATKKAAAEFPCTHCEQKFRALMKWCTSCECHAGTSDWTLGKDVCNGCRAGANARYLKWKVGHADRVAAVMADIAAKYGPMREPFDSPLGRAYDAWCASDAYGHRFDTVEDKARPVATPEQENEEWINEFFAGL